MHEEDFALRDGRRMGLSLSGGYAVQPEQSALAIVAHHPQAVYFGMKSGFVPKDKAPDELIAGTERGGALPKDDDPEEVDEDPAGEATADAPAMAGGSE